MDDKPSSEYRQWYQWWTGWHKGMSNNKWDSVNNMLSDKMSDEDILFCRPEGQWQDQPV